MIEKQTIADYAKRETLQGTILVKILFGKPVPEAINAWKAIRWYPQHSSRKKVNKSLADEKLARSIVARFHSSPDSVDLEGLSDIEFNIQEFCTWLIDKNKTIPNFNLSPSARLFVETALGANEIKGEPQAKATKKSGKKASPLKPLVIEEALKIRKNGITSAPKIARMSAVTKIIAPNADHTLIKDLSNSDYEKRYKRPPGTVEDWIREGFRDNPINE